MTPVPDARTLNRASGRERTARSCDPSREISEGTPRILFYSHDSYGLGHLRRTLALAHHLHGHWPQAPQLIVTGSPTAEPFDVPDTADYVKLPAVLKVGAGEYESRSMPIPFQDVLSLRRDVIDSAARAFRPDLVIVDNVPNGLKGELVPALRHLKETGATRIVLTLRDVVDEAARVVPSWKEDGVYELLDEIYDLIIVYGDRGVHDPIREYRLSSRAAGKTHFAGYISRGSTSVSPARARAQLELHTARLVVVTAGGGGDGYALLHTALEALRSQTGSRSFDCLVVTGPLMPAEERDALRSLVPGDAAVHFCEFVPELASYLAAADVVVSMGGYNSISEILSFRRPAVVVPRVEPRREQLIRVAALANRGLVRMIHPDDLTPGRLLGEIQSLISDPSRSEYTVPMDGLAAATRHLERLMIVESRPTLPRAAGQTARN